MVYPEVRGNRVLKLEGETNKSVADAIRRLEDLLDGEIALRGRKPIWTASFGVGEGIQGEVKKLETRLGVMIVRNKRRSRLHIYGAPGKRREAIERLEELVAKEASAARFVELTGDQLTWVCRGGFRAIASALGPDVVAFDVSSTPQRILVTGSNDNFKRASRMVTEMADTGEPGEKTAAAEDDCAICLTPAEDFVRTRCNHTYCADCFEAMCFSISTGPSKFCIKCEACQSELPFEELQDLLPSSSFEDLLEASFASHIKRNPNILRTCRTPDCDQVYRATEAQGTFACTRCLELTCTKCHQGHEGMSC